MTDEPDVPQLDEISFSIPSGLKVTTERPYRILVVSDLAGADGGTLAGPLNDKVVEVRADSFDALLAQAAPTLRYTAADPLAAVGSAAAMIEVNLRITSLRDFDPGNLAGQMSQTRSLMDARRNIVARLRGQATPAQLTGSIAAAAAADSALAWLPEAVKPKPAAAAVAAPEAVDDLLGAIDLGDPQAADPQMTQRATEKTAKSPVSSIIAAAASMGGVPAEESSALRRALAEIDRRIGVWLNAVLHSPQVQALETAWRSLAFLITKTDFRKGVRLSLLHAPRAALLERFRTLFIDPVFDAGADAPDVIVVDAAFTNSAPDIEALDELAQNAASLPAVLLAGAAPGFLGVKHAWQVPTLPALINTMDQWQFAKWKTLRSQPHARSLGLVFGRGLLRMPYGRDQAGDLELNFREECLGEKDLLWAGGAIAAGCSIARSVADTGWPTAMAGYVHGRVEGFLSCEGGQKGEKTFGPTDTQLPMPKIEELAAVGLNALVCLRDHPDAIVWNGLSPARPDKIDTNSFLEISLPYQLFAGRLASLLFALKPHLPGVSADQVVPFVAKHVADWMQFEGQPTPEQLSVLTRPADDNPAVVQLAVTVTPPQRILPGGIPVVMGYRLT